ncbi:MAG: recombinase family protein [Pseudomonadota bacterium]
MRVGYARVSTTDQNIDLQVDALRKAGCAHIFEDHASGMKADRDGYAEVMRALQPGDTLVVWRLDRLARSMRDLTDTMHSLHQRGIGFHSICEHIDISSAYGEFVLHILSAVAHFERALIVERTRAGMAAAKARGVTFGRAPALNGEELNEALFLIGSGQSVASTARHLGVGRSTLFRHLATLKR